MTAKKWTFLFIGSVIIFLIALMSMNFFIDPLGYFRAQGGTYKGLNDEYYLREVKAEQIRNFPDKYDAYIIGGSKAGALRTDKLSELDGYSYYNCWQLSGNFQDYYYYTKFIVEKAHPKKILLHLSTNELKSIDRESYGDLYEIPAQVRGDSKVTEVFKFLFKNPSLSIDELKKDKSRYFPCSEDGERDLTKYYERYRDYTDTYYEEHFTEDVEKYISYLTKGVPEREDVVESCITDLKNMKQLCDQNNVEFQVIVGSVYIGELVRFESPDLYNFLEQLVLTVGDVWCFNDVNPISCNPANYYNSTHYFYEVGNLMIDTITQKQHYEGFGTHLTLGNIASYINGRKVEWEKVRQYYIKNNELPLRSDKESNIVFD